MQLYIRKSMKVKTNDLPLSSLNFSEIERFANPYNSELGSGEEDKSPQSKFGKHARLLYQSLLEKIVETAFRLGIPLDRDKQAVLSLLVEGKTVIDIVRLLNIENKDVKRYAYDAIAELNRFMDNLSTIEEEREKARHQLELQEIRHKLQVKRLNEKINGLQEQIEENPRIFLNEPISLLPFTPYTRDILLRAGFFTIGDVLAVPLEELRTLPGMTEGLFQALKRYLKKVQSRQNLDNKKC